MKDASLITSFLSVAAHFPDSPDSVELIETDEAWIVLAGETVYKVYQSIKRDERDLSTLAGREKACQRELRWNRPLAPGIYLDVVSIFGDENHLSFVGEGEPVEYALKMRRLPDDRKLSNRLGDPAFPWSELDPSIDRLVEFARSAKAAPKSSKAGTRVLLSANVDRWLAEVAECIGPTESVGRLESALLLFLARMAETLEERMAHGKVIEGHGNLIADHLFLCDPPIMVGSVDARDRDRHGDVLLDIAALYVDLHQRGHEELAEHVAARWCAPLQEDPNDDLSWFYRAYRTLALARRQRWIHADEEGGRRATSSYIELANLYASHFYTPRMFVTVGLMGTGKTVLSEALANEFGLKRVSSEEVSRRLYPADSSGKSKANRLDLQQSDHVYQEMIVEARHALLMGRSVVLDGSFLRSEYRRDAVDMAREIGVDPLVLECRLGSTDTIARLDRRFKKNRTRPGSRPELLDEQKQLFEPIEDLSSDVVQVLNMNQTVPEIVEQVREEL